MPKKKGLKKHIPKDFSINDCANARKPVTREKKSSSTEATPLFDIPWDQVPDNDFNIMEEVSADGTKTLTYKERRKNTNLETVEEQEGTTYPEIVWYLISKHIEPEDVGRFALINKSTHDITKQKAFWQTLYNKYCYGNPRLPERLKIDSSFKSYGLKQRVIKALYHTHEPFIEKVTHQATQDSKPHDLVRHRCVNVWFHKGSSGWAIFFKFRKFRQKKLEEKVDFIRELGRIDVNPEEGSQVMQVNCQFFYEVPPLMGMTLSSVNVGLSKGFCTHRLHMGFNSGQYVSKNIQPECSIVLDTVINILVLDWWHPSYPHYDIKLPWDLRDEEALPVLNTDFFALRDID